MNLYVSCQSGLQQVLKKELQILGYKPTIIKSTLLGFQGDESAIVQTNLRLRTANKVYLEVANKKAETFDQLFDFVYAEDRAKYISPESKFIVKATSSNSKLFSIPSIQSISEKAIHKKLENTPSKIEGTRGSNQTELREPTEILFSLDNNNCSILINTSGDSLHKRGYKTNTGEAPINEALAA